MANTRFPSSNTNETTETSTTSSNLPFTSTLENINREMGNITKGIAAQLTSINNSYKAWIKNRDDRKREKAKEEKNNDKKRKEEHVSLKKILSNLGKDIKNSVSSFGKGIFGSISNLVSGISGMISSAISGIFGDSPISKLLTSPIALAVLGIYAAVQWLSQRFGFKAKEQKRQKLLVDLKSKRPEDLTDEESVVLEKSEDYDTAKGSLADAIQKQKEEGKITNINSEGFVNWKAVRNEQREYSKKQRDFNKTADELIKKRETEAEEATKRAESRSKEKATSTNVAAANTNVNNNNITNNNTIINQTSSAKSNAVTNKR